MCEDRYATLEDCDALVICTEWNEFHQIDLERVGDLMRDRVIFDGRNLYPTTRLREAGFDYHSVGRASTTSRTEAVRAVS